jgi:N-acetylglucosamine-6-phosphate deacetylase
MSELFLSLGSGGMQTVRAVEEGGRLRTEPAEGRASRYLVPGFVDLHIHGAFGFDFMGASPDELLALADRLEKSGYEAFFPTTVSASAAEIARALENLPDDPRMPGFHLEGPFLSPKFPGAQPPEAILDPTPDNLAEWENVLAHPKLALATLAPERPGALALASRLSRRGVRVSMGHTDATTDEAAAGFEAGVRHATHSFNAMRGLHHREAGAVGYLLAQDELFAELIYDRRHVSREAAALLIRCKPADKVIAVSDGTMAAGAPPGNRLRMWGHEVETRPGAVVLAGTETLAGSAITLLEAFRNLAEDFGVETAIRACCLNPRLAMGMPSEPRVWVEFSPELELARVRRGA